MPALLLLLTLVVAVTAAIRSTWSPCGLSMLSSITPLAEQGRGHRFRSTATWFVVGAVAGGLSIGAAMAVLAAGVAALGITVTTALGVAACSAVVVALSDSRLLGVKLPGHIRQVNESWLNQYRSWVYGAGFGWQIGVGFATFIVTAAVYLMVVLSALTASPAQALLVGLTFGLVRGLAILLGTRITTPEALIAFHRRFDVWGERMRRITIGVEAAVAAVASVATWGVGVASLAIAAVSAIVVVATVRRRADASLPTPSGDRTIGAPAPSVDRTAIDLRLQPGTAR